MGRRIASGIAFVLALSAGVLVGGPTGQAVAFSPAPPGSAPSSGGASPPTVGQQVEKARNRLQANLRMPHPGKSEVLAHPSQDRAGSGIAGNTRTDRTSQLAPRVQAPAISGSSQIGLDVSGHQGNVNWSQVAADGATFAYVKATQATSYRNGYFAQQYNGSYAAGLVRGAYHFAIPNDSGGAAQADYFVANGGGWSADGRTLPGMLDIEYNPYGSVCFGLTQSQMVSWIASFDKEYAALTGRRPVIYTTTDWWGTCTGNSSAFGQEPLSIANYSGSPYPLPSSWSIYTFWQYADSGTFPGDQERFNGDYQALVAFANGRATPDRIVSGQELHSGAVITSVNGYKIAMQADGNLVEYDSAGRALWASRTSRNPGAYVAMQADGNLVVYLGGRALWNTRTSGRGPSYAVIQGDANFVIRTNIGTATWSSRGGTIG